MFKKVAKLVRYFIPQFVMFRAAGQDKHGALVQLDDIVGIVPGQEPGHSVVKLKTEDDIDIPYDVATVAKAFAGHWSNVAMVPRD